MVLDIWKEESRVRGNAYRGKGCSGFGMVEVVVSVVLLSLVVAGSYKLITQAARLNRTARNHYVAANLAKNRIEHARNYAFADLPLLRESKVLVNAQGATETAGPFRRSTLVNTNFGYKLTEFTVIIEIRNSLSGQFQGEEQRIASLFTDYSDANP